MEDEGIQDEEDEIAYKERIRNELNRGMQERRTSAELTSAVPQTVILDSTAAKGKAELARQGSLADRQLPANLAARRQNSNPSDPGAGSAGASACASRNSEEEEEEDDENLEDRRNDDENDGGVRFDVDGVAGGIVGDGDNNDRQRLHRRDTPHHLKNKRINQQVDKDKVANIIAQALQKKGVPGDAADLSQYSSGGAQTSPPPHDLGIPPHDSDILPHDLGIPPHDSD